MANGRLRRSTNVSLPKRKLNPNLNESKNLLDFEFAKKLLESENIRILTPNSITK